jgi:glycosyltransferase involved in cell wall biosynthesis
LCGEIVKETSKQPRLVALFAPSLAGGGAERVLVNLASGLRSRQIDVDVVLAAAVGPFLSELQDIARVIDLKASRIAYSVGPLARYLHVAGPDALISFLDHANVAAIAAAALSRRSIPVFASVHVAWSTALKNSKWKHLLIGHIARFAYPHAAGIIFVSRGAEMAAKNYLGIIHKNSHVIYNPIINDDLFSKAESEIEHPWFGKQHPPVVLGIGRLTQQKQFATLIRSFSRLRSIGPAKLMILGEGEERPSLEALVKNLGLSGDVALPGFIRNPYPYLRQASVFVLSSAWEGLPTVLVEALALGTPIVSTDCPSGPSEILGGGQYGALVPVGDTEAMTTAIYRAITGEHQRPDGSSWLKFTTSVATAAYVDILTQVPSRKSR